MDNAATATRLFDRNLCQILGSLLISIWDMPTSSAIAVGLFPTVEEMDQAILERLNASVKANDIPYFLGDFCIGNQARILEYRRRIRCKKIFAVPGNHDKQARKLKEEFS